MVDWSKSRLWSEVPFDEDGRHFGDIHLPFSDNSVPLGAHTIPLIVIRRGTGPTLTVIGATHGDEYEGMAAIMKLAHAIDPDQLTGRLILLPAVSGPAARHAARCSPLDGANLNRAFPGDPDGGPTAMIAHAIETVLLPASDAVIDIHSGGKASIFASLSMITRAPDGLDRKNLALAKAFGLPLIWWLGALNDTRSLNAAARRQGVAMMACEIGGCGALRPDTLAEAYHGIHGVMASLGMIEAEAAREVVAYREIEARDRACQLLAPLDGLFVPARAAGEDVVAGEAAGAIHHPFEPERPPTPLHFARAGVITAQLNRGLVRRGEQLYWVGQPVN